MFDIEQSLGAVLQMHRERDGQESALRQGKTAQKQCVEADMKQMNGGRSNHKIEKRADFVRFWLNLKEFGSFLNKKVRFVIILLAVCPQIHTP